jgi:hypothetical protein
MQCAAGALRNVGEMTKQYTLVSLLNGRNNVAIATDGFHKILKMQKIKITIGASCIRSIVSAR